MAAKNQYAHLTEKQQLFVNAVLDGKPTTVAMKLAGYAGANKGNAPFLKLPKIQEALRRGREKLEQRSLMTRKRVLDGLLEAIDQAKVQSEPMSQIAGWREIARMCGYYAPEQKNVNITLSHSQIISQLEHKSDAELLEIIEGEAQRLNDNEALLTHADAEAPRQAA